MVVVRQIEGGSSSHFDEPLGTVHPSKNWLAKNSLIRHHIQLVHRASGCPKYIDSPTHLIEPLGHLDDSGSTEQGSFAT